MGKEIFTNLGSNIFVYLNLCFKPSKNINKAIIVIWSSLEENLSLGPATNYMIKQTCSATKTS